MGYPTDIEWTDATDNAVGGCSIESPGCIHCYAQGLAGTRLAHLPLYAGTTDRVKGRPVFNGKLTVAADGHYVWQWPLRWRGAKQPLLGPGQPSLIFVCDMSDLFHPDRPVEVIDRVLARIVYSSHIGQLLTKRPQVMHAYFEELRRSGRWLLWPHPLFGAPNFDPYVASFDSIRSRLWLGASVERQPEADKRREAMRALADMGFTTFVSYEPALGPVDWTGWEFLSQLISGGESGKGPRARPSHPDWHRAARDFCAAHEIAYFFKQWGDWRAATVTEQLGHGRTPMAFGSLSREGQFIANTSIGITNGLAALMLRLGSSHTGRLLDGREHNGLPSLAKLPSVRVPAEVT
jgi:protein gp37